MITPYPRNTDTPMNSLEPYVQLESKFQSKFRTHPTVAVSTGSAALHLALEALDLPCGSEVIVPEFTMVACARAVTMAGLIPRFVDCGPDLLFSPEKIAEAITSNTSAIMAVHIYGRVCDMNSIMGLADIRNLYVIEDLAEAHGVPHHPNTDAACWSFYKNKIIAGEEGGMIALKNPGTHARARLLRSLGRDYLDFIHIPRGVNARLSNAHAKLILDSLDKYSVNSARRHKIAEWYDALMPKEYRMPRREANWVYDIRIPGCTQQKQNFIVNTLNSHGIAVRPGFRPMSEQPEYLSSTYQDLEAYRLSREIIYFPIDTERMDYPQVRHAVDRFKFCMSKI